MLLTVTYAESSLSPRDTLLLESSDVPLIILVAESRAYVPPGFWDL